MIFLCLHLTKSQFPAGLFVASFHVFLTTCTVGHWKEVSTENGFEHTSLWWTESLGKNYQILGTRTKKNDGPKSCCAPTSSFRGGFYQHCRLSGLPSHSVKWSGLNQTGLIIVNVCKPNQPVWNSKPFQEVL